MKKTMMAVSAALALGLCANGVFAQTPSPSAEIKEMHGDWSVTCAAQDQGRSKACVVSQTQVDPKNHQRIVTMEVAPAPTPSGSSAATLVMPFGLVVDRGVALQVNNAPMGGPARFQTCLPVGCLVQLQLDGKTMRMLRQGGQIKLTGISAADGHALQFTIPLRGLGEASDRALALVK